MLVGTKAGLSRETLFAAFKNQDYDSVIWRYRIATGDTIYVPAGVLHSFGPDTLVFEVQQTSDLGQFVMPTDIYGQRLTNEMWEQNIERALDEMRPERQTHPHAGLTRHVGANRVSVGCAGPYFALERWTLTAPYRVDGLRRRCMTLTNVGSAVQIVYGGGSETLAQGESCILPAALDGVEIVGADGASLIACYVPNMQQDIVQPLRAAGYSDHDIGALGEVTFG